jgi:hypothetical protein
MTDLRTNRARLRGFAGHRAFADAEPSKGVAGQPQHPSDSLDKTESPPAVRGVCT